jgi:hypothetical protein
VDEHQFGLAVQSADEDHSPAALRAYLANSKRQTHREESR